MLLRRWADLRRKSLSRATILALISLLVAFPLSGYPEVHLCWWLMIPFFSACFATWETARCLQKKWSFYHGAVLLLIYVNLMIVLMIAFLWLAPFSDQL
jgi:hypothetical protein